MNPQTKTLAYTTFLLLLITTLVTSNYPQTKADSIVVANQNFVFNTGESFRIQDLYNAVNITFTVTTGTLTAIGSIYTDNTIGTLTLNPTTIGTLTISSVGTTIYTFLNGSPYLNPLAFTPGNPFTLTWSFAPTPIPTPVINLPGTQNVTYYLRSDTQTSNNITAYALAQTNTAITSTLSDTASGSTVTFGYRVFIIHYNGASTELTSGSPTATVTRSTTGAGYQTSTWTPAFTTLDFGYDALEVIVYKQVDSGIWIQKGIYLTAPLMYKAVMLQTWTFTIYTSALMTVGTVTSSYSFGEATKETDISGVGFVNPTQWDIQTWNMNNGNWFAFTLGAYTAQIGSAAYLIMALIPTATLYIRYRSFTPVVFMFILFGGSGGLIWFFIPLWAAAVTDALLILGFAFIVWKLIR